MILVVGATGLLGREICQRLAARGTEVRGLVREASDASVVRSLREQGVQTVVGDLRDRESLERALRGAHRVVSTATVTRSRQPDETIETTDGQGQLDLIDAAAAAGLEHFAYVSFSGTIGRNDPLTHAKRAAEAKLRSSGMSYTILRPSVFMEVWLSPPLGFDYEVGTATVYGTGENPISWISQEDVAEFAVAALEPDAAPNAVVELGGPEQLTPLQVVSIFEEISGRLFEIRFVPVEALNAQFAASTDSLEKAFASLMLSYAAGDPMEPQRALKIPKRLTSVRDYARRVLSKKVPPPAAV